MKKYAQFELRNGTYHKVSGYLEDYHDIPKDAIEITDAEEMALNNGKDLKTLDSKELVDTPVSDADKLSITKGTKVSALQALLASTDYEAIKYAEGQLTAEQYAKLKTARESWRATINAVQSATTIDAVNAIRYSTEITAVD